MSDYEMHPDQHKVTVEDVQHGLQSEFPYLASSLITVLASGTVNAVFKIGEEFVARFPLVVSNVSESRRNAESEVKAAKLLLGRTRFVTPDPIGIGRPTSNYPGYWSVQTRVPGVTATGREIARSDKFALDLAELILDIRGIPTSGQTFTGSGRGGDLRSHDDWMTECFAKSEALLDVYTLRQLWEQFKSLPRISKDVMSHGDLMPGNVLVDGMRLVGVVDVDGIAPADPALDLVSAWHLLDAGPRQLLRDALGSDELEWTRGKAWAFEQAMGLVWYYKKSNPVMSAIGRRTLRRIMEDPNTY